MIIHDGIDIEILLKLIENCDFERIVTIALRWEGGRGGEKVEKGKSGNFPAVWWKAQVDRGGEGAPPPTPPPTSAHRCVYSTLGYRAFMCGGVLSKYTVCVFVFCCCYTLLGSPICVPFIFHIRQWLWIMLVYVYCSSWVFVLLHSLSVYFLKYKTFVNALVTSLCCAIS